MTVGLGRLASTLACVLVLLLCIVGEHLFSRYTYNRTRWQDVLFTIYAVGCLAYLAAT